MHLTQQRNLDPLDPSIAWHVKYAWIISLSGNYLHECAIKALLTVIYLIPSNYATLCSSQCTCLQSYISKNSKIGTQDGLWGLCVARKNECSF